MVQSPRKPVDREKARIRDRRWKQQHPERAKADGLLYYQRHREAIVAKARKWYRDHKVRAVSRQAAWYAAHPEVRRAHTAVHNAVQRGVLIKPNVCTRCGAPTPKRLLDGHHPDYAKPLEVVWVCKRCHRQLEKDEAVSLGTVA